MAKKRKLPPNYMDILFERNPEQKWNQNEDSSVSLEMEHSGFFDRIAQRFFKKPRVSHIALDKYGSAVWLALDGTKTVFDVLNMMNKQSGLLGISGLSSDMRDIDAAADKYDGNAMLARDMLVYGIKKYIGSYAAAMGGVDMIVFTAGIGENNGALRERIMSDMEFLGVKLDHARNAACADGHATECVISSDDSRVKVLVIPTNEEIMIARDTLELVSK